MMSACPTPSLFMCLTSMFLHKLSSVHPSMPAEFAMSTSQASPRGRRSSLILISRSDPDSLSTQPEVNTVAWRSLRAILASVRSILRLSVLNSQAVKRAFSYVSSVEKMMRRILAFDDPELIVKFWKNNGLRFVRRPLWQRSGCMTSL